MVDLEREAKEKLNLDVDSEDDPTTATVRFAFTDKAQTDARPGTTGFAAWSSGTWKGPPVEGGGEEGAWRRVAVTPLLGQAPLDLTEGVTWQAWSEVTLGTEVAVDRCGTVKVK